MTDAAPHLNVKERSVPAATILATALTDIGVAEEERWADYHRLQVYDRFSLFFCLNDLESAVDDDIGGYRLETLGSGRVRMDPYPFVSETADFTLLRRILPKQRRTIDEFRHELLGTPAERLEVSVESA